MSADNVLCHALEDAIATSTRLSLKPSIDPQQPLTIRLRAAHVQPPAKINLPSPLEGHKLYSLHQVISTRNRSSALVNYVVSEMIEQGIVLVKKAAIFWYAQKYAGGVKTEAPIFWIECAAGQDIMLIGDLKSSFSLIKISDPLTSGRGRIPPKL